LAAISGRFDNGKSLIAQSVKSGRPAPARGGKRAVLSASRRTVARADEVIE
jgi:hypothetical protein